MSQQEEEEEPFECPVCQGDEEEIDSFAKLTGSLLACFDLKSNVFAKCTTDMDSQQ